MIIELWNSSKDELLAKGSIDDPVPPKVISWQGDYFFESVYPMWVKMPTSIVTVKSCLACKRLVGMNKFKLASGQVDAGYCLECLAENFIANLG